MDSTRVRDFTDSASKQVRIEVDPSPAYELLFELFSLDNTEDSVEYAGGKDWIEEKRGRLPKEFLDSLETLKTGGELWLLLLSLAYDTPSPKTVEAFIEYVGDYDADALRARLLENAWFTKEQKVSADVIERALAGDADAFAAICEAADECECGPGWSNLLPMDAASAKRSILDLLETYADKAFDSHVSRVLDRDARSKRVLAATLDPLALIERATNGITFANMDGVEAVVLVPSVVIRPFVVATDYGAIRMIGYGVPEELLVGDQDAPPGWLVDLYKAIGDEKRMRILTILAESDTTLKDLVDRLEVSKSTVHHHLRLLRAAGLVRLTVGDEHVYSLRADAIPQAGPLLASYLEQHGPNETE